jgi:hypothetical protein
MELIVVGLPNYFLRFGSRALQNEAASFGAENGLLGLGLLWQYAFSEISILSANSPVY